MRNFRSTTTPVLAAALLVVSPLLSGWAAMAQGGDYACVPYFENRWHMVTTAGAPVATAFFNGHVATSAADPAAPSGAGYAVIASQFGLPVFVAPVTVNPSRREGTVQHPSFTAS